MGFGQSGQERTSNTNLNNLFNYALPQSQQQQSAGSGNLNTAGNFFKSLLGAGRSETASRSAPAVNAALEQSDAAKRQAAAQGTSRGGGTAAANREAGTATRSSIDNIINQNLMAGQQQGAKGLTDIGGTQLSNAGQLLGIGAQGQEATLDAAVNKEGQQNKIFGDVLGDVVSAFI